MVSDDVLAANAQENGLNSSVVQWTQAMGHKGLPNLTSLLLQKTTSTQLHQQVFTD